VHIDAKATAAGFVVLAPNSECNSFTNCVWGDTSTALDPAGAVGDVVTNGCELAFFVDAARCVSDVLQVPLSGDVYALGFSQGGKLASRFGCEGAGRDILRIWLSRQQAAAVAAFPGAKRPRGSVLHPGSVLRSNVRLLQPVGKRVRRLQIILSSRLGDPGQAARLAGAVRAGRSHAVRRHGSGRRHALAASLHQRPEVVRRASHACVRRRLG